jgi:transcriptional regulator
MTRKPKGSDDGKLNIPQGTLDLMIMTIVRREPLHGYGITQRLKALTRGAFQINPGSLFPALYALERDGKLRCEERPSENNRPARYYSLTSFGRKELGQAERRWERVSAAITAVLQGA